MPAIDVTNLSFSFSAQPLLENVSFSVGDGESAFLVGPNGSGKTTLLRIICGEIAPDSGVATISGVPDASSFSVPHVHGAHGTVEEYLDGVLTGPRGMLARFDEVTRQLADGHAARKLVDEYDRLLASLTAIDVWSLQARTEETLAGLGLPQLAGDGQQRPLSSLSPGQAGRLELAGIILARPAVLILDEPTNHLDDDAVAYLTDQIVHWSGPVLMASHDRAFIEDNATVIYDLDIATWQALATAEGGEVLPGVYRCAGDYSDYVEAKQHARVKHKGLHSAQQNEKRSIRMHRRRSEDIAHGGVRLATAEGKARKFFSDRAEKTALQRTRHDDQRFDNLVEREVRKPRTYQLHLELPKITPSGGMAVTARGATVPGRLHATTFDLGQGEHLLLTGPNGAGKTTLLRWIDSGHPPAGAVNDASGTISVNGKLAYVPQQLPQPGDPYITEEMWESGIGEHGAGILHPAMWTTPIDQLSDGNQRRTQIALAVAQAPEILVIDEPTNYLDLAVIEELESTLRAWNGTLIIASHDRWLIEHWHDKRLELQPASWVSGSLELP